MLAVWVLGERVVRQGEVKLMAKAKQKPKKKPKPKKYG